jgi:vitamin B12 transporter
MIQKFLLACSLLYSVNAISQNEIPLDPVTITSNRMQQRITETGRSVTVLDGKLFSKLPVHSLDEMLRYVQGVEVQQRGPAGSQSDIVIRGGTFQQVLVLIDGIKINDPVTGHFSSYIPIAPYEIERIEILRGPASAIYGAEAVGGVINIVSKVFARHDKSKASAGTASLGLGEYGWVNGNAGLYVTGSKVNFSAGLLSSNSFGQPVRGARGFFYNTTGSVSAGIALGKSWQLMLRSSVDRRRFNAQNFYTSFVSDTATEKVITWWNQAKLRRSNDKNTDDIDLVYKQLSDNFAFNRVAIANNNQSAYAALQYVHTAKVSPCWSVSYGLQLDSRRIRSNDRGNHSTAHGATFLGMSFAYKKLHVHPAIRVDYDENFGVEILPQINAAVTAGKYIFRANAGRAIRSADFTERYNNYNKPRVTGGSIGNPGLDAERSWGYDAGIDLVTKSFKAGVTAFLRNQDEVIDWFPTPYSNMPRTANLVPGGSYALARNIKTVNTRGLELDMSVSKTLGRHRIFANVGATLLRSAGSDSIPSFYIVSHASMLLQGSLVYHYSNLSISANALYKERDAQQAAAIKAQISSSYLLINLRAAYVFYKKMSAFAAVTNTGNIVYSDLLGSRMPGRWLTGGVCVDF